MTTTVATVSSKQTAAVGTLARVKDLMKKKLDIEKRVGSEFDFDALARMADIAFHDSIDDLHSIVKLPNEREEIAFDANGQAVTVTKTNIPFKIAASNSIINAQRVIMDRKAAEGGKDKKGITVTFSEEDRIQGADGREKKTTKTISSVVDADDLSDDIGFDEGEEQHNGI